MGMDLEYGLCIIAEAQVRPALAFDRAKPWFSRLGARAVFPGLVPGPH